MHVLYPRCAGIDVHKRTVVVAARWLDEHDRSRTVTRTYASTTADLEQLAAWLTTLGVTHAAMESTGVYWRPVFNILEEHVGVILANAYHVKAVPGRKTDMRDAEWLADLLQHGLLQASFIPPAPIRALRELTRYRASLIEERTREVNRLQGVLEMANIKLATVATDVMGVSGRAMLQAIVDGVEDPDALADLAQYRLRRKLPELRRALEGRVLTHHRLLLRQLLAHIDFLEAEIGTLSEEIATRLEAYPAEVTLLRSIPGIGQRVAETLIAELGADLAAFASARHLASWAALCPGNHESAGKRLRGSIRHGNRRLKAVLIQAAWAAIRTKGCYFGAFFRRIAKRRGDHRAVIAVAHRLLTVIYHVLTDHEPYHELGADYHVQRDAEAKARYHLRQLAVLGYEVSVSEPPAA